MTSVMRPGSGAHDDDPRRQEDRLRDRMGHEHDGDPGLLPDAQDLLVHPLAGHLVERTERLVHQQDRRLEGERPGDRDPLLHPARQLVRMVLDEVAQLDEVEHLLGPRAPSRAVVAHQLERELDVVLDRPPVEQDRRLEDHPVVAIEAGPGGRLAVDLDRAGGRCHEVADDPQQGRLAAARRADQRDELPAPDLEVDALERGRGRRVAGEDLVDALDPDDRSRPIVPAHPSAAPGRPRSATSSSARIITKNVTPSSDGDEDRRPQLLGAGDVLLVEVDDRPAEAVGDAARPLADDRPDDRRGRGDLERREQVRHRRRQAELPVRGRARRPRTSASARARAGPAPAGRGSSRS